MRGQVPRSAFGPRRMLSALLAVVVLAAWPGASVLAETPPSAAYGSEAVHAMFLFNFINFTEWPADALPANAPFVVGVAGSRALEDELLSLADKQTVRNRRVRVVRVKTARDLEGCHVLYISPTTIPGEENGPGAEELLPQVRNRPVLTVSELPSFLAQGGIINLYAGEKGAYRFEIAPETARASGLVLSSKLLALARIVNPPALTKRP